MAGIQETLRGARERLTERRVPDAADRTNVLRRLTGADYLSLGALLLGWTSAVLLVRGEPNWGLVVMFGAYSLDKLDGWYARRSGEASPFGRRVDSFIDIFVYLVPAALLFHLTQAPNSVVGTVVGFLVLAFGGLRLIRHNSEGFGTDEDGSYYHGTTVVHTNVVVVASYFLGAFVPLWNGWIAGLCIAAVCPLMVSNYKAYKNDLSHVLAGVLGAVMSTLAIGLELGLL